MKHKRCISVSLVLALVIGLTPKKAFAPLPGSAGGVDWINGGRLPSTGFRPSGGGGGGLPGGGGGAGFNPAAGIIGGMVAGAILDWALSSGPSAAEQEAAKRKMAELEAERARLQALAEEQARKARIGSAGRLRNAWDQQDKESRERLQGVFDVFRNFQSIDPFGDFLFHGVPIYRPEGGPLIVRHLDPNGLAAQADEWGKALEGAEERAQKLWSKMQDQSPVESTGTIGHTTPANQAGAQNPAGMNEPGMSTDGTGNTPGNTGESIPSGGQPDVSGGTQTGNNTVPNQATQQPGNVQTPGTGGQAGQSGAGEGSLHYRTGAFGTREVAGVPGPEFNTSPFDTKVVDLRDRLTDIPRIPGSTPQAGRIGNIPVTQGTKIPVDRVVVPSPTIIPKSVISIAADNVADKYYNFLVWYNDPMHRGWVDDAIFIGTAPLLFSDLLTLGGTALPGYPEAKAGESLFYRRGAFGMREVAGLPLDDLLPPPTLNYADTATSGLSKKLQEAIVSALRDDDIILVRARAPGAGAWDGIHPAKPPEGEVLVKLDNGLRIMKDLKNGGQVVSSDLDIACIVHKGAIVDNGTAMSYGEGINLKFGSRLEGVVTHGDLVNGVLAEIEKALATADKNEVVFVFSKSRGYLKSGPLMDMLKEYAPQAHDVVDKKLYNYFPMKKLLLGAP